MDVVDAIASVEKPSDLARLLTELGAGAEPEDFTAEGVVRGGLARRVKRLVRRVLRRLGYIAVPLCDYLEWRCVLLNLYGWLGRVNLARLVDIVLNPREWDELYWALDAEGRRAFMAWLRVGAGLLLARPRVVFEKLGGLELRGYYAALLELQERCRGVEGEGHGLRGVCVYRVRGLRGEYLVYTEPMFYLDTWVYRVYPEPGSGAIVFDVGAYTGETSVWLYDRGAAKVYAVEPLEPAYRLLVETVRVNGLDDSIVAVRAALGPRDGGSLPGVSSRVMRLDTLVEELGVERVDYVKMDVEGLEGGVLEGARRVVERFRPVFVVAGYHSPRQPIEVWRLLRSMGYERFTFRMRAPKLADVLLVAW